MEESVALKDNVIEMNPNSQPIIKKELTEVQKLKAINIQLKMQLGQLVNQLNESNLKLASLDLRFEMENLSKEVGSEIDWKTLKLKD